ncbi:hypothetical protein SteCoe_29975 [Stentor coeruleus]|uniref:Uncharacterized protein n=1 Tax=Stentor coeruleus TaxID=5963 RepID=A0A1R2B4L0_9CILI|nr:hypothetical protein SteCoe_29975 [Stentor coeruleus]
MNNIVTFPISKLTKINKNWWTFIKIGEITDPNKGFPHNPFEDYENTFDLYDYWTGNFRIFTVADRLSLTADSKSYTSASYSNLNAAYTGYFQSSIIFLRVNNDEPIQLRNGTYTDWIKIDINDNVFNASFVQIKAKNYNYDGPLDFSDNGIYNLSDTKPFSYFKVGAPSSSVYGQYYISWLKIIEKSYDGKSIYYRAPAKTIVQICNLSVYTIQVGQIYKTPMRINSIPITLSLGPVSPFTGFYISIYLSSENYNSNIFFYPNVLNFSSGISEASFSIITGDIILSRECKFEFSIDGTDAQAFDIVKTHSFFIGTITNDDPEANFIITDIGCTHISVNLSTNGVGVITWALMSEFMYYRGKYSTEFFNIENNSRTLIENKGLSIKEQESIFFNELLLLDDINWDEYCLNVFLMARKIYFTSQNFVHGPEISKLYDFNYLVSDNSYVLVGYFDNFSGNDPYYFENFVSTLSVKEPANIDITFYEDIQDSNDTLIEILSNVIKVNKNRLVVINSTRRALNTQISLSLKPNALENWSSFTKLESFNLNEINNTLIENGFPKSKISISQPYVNPQSFLSSEFFIYENFIVFNIEVYKDGVICCEYEFDADLNITLTSDQINLKFDRNWKNASDKIECIKARSQIYETIQFNISKFFEENLEYNSVTFTCNACDNDPISPQCVSEGEFLQHTYNGLKEQINGYSKMLVISIILAYLN